MSHNEEFEKELNRTPEKPAANKKANQILYIQGNYKNNTRRS
jgi:hypothetical protein